MSRRRLPFRDLLVAMSLLTACLGTSSPARAGSPAAALVDDRLLLVEVTLDRLSLTDALPAYQADDGSLVVPVGALTRLLDLDVRVQIAEGRITGNIGEARRPIMVDLSSGEARAGGQRIPVGAGDAVAGANDIFVSLGLLQRLLPLNAVFDTSALTLDLQALEPLPVQERLSRLGRSGALRGLGRTEEKPMEVDSPIELLSWPSFDVTLETGTDTRAGGIGYRYDVRAGSDLLGAGLQTWMSSDNRGKPMAARVLLEQRYVEGGPLGLTRLSVGDTFVPTLALGPRSVSARGFSFSSAPLGQASVFERTDLRGELPVGHDVELYINDVLAAAQSSPVQGRYEFTDVPLTRGVNVVRIVDYGPHGERSETVRVITVGGGQLAAGQTVVEGGIGQQEFPVLNLSPAAVDTGGTPGAGDLRAALNLTHGFSELFTGALGLATYTAATGDRRSVLNLGLRGSMLGMAVEANAARDQKSGSAYALAVAGKPFGVALTARHSEYRGGFIDETTPRGGYGRALTRSSEATLDWTLPLGRDRGLPLSMRAARDEYLDGTSDLYGTFRTSAAFGSFFASGGLDYERSSGAADAERLTGNLSLSTFAAFAWQIRSSLDYELVPDKRLRSLAVTVDRSIGEDQSLRFGYGRSFADDGDNSVEAGLNFRFGAGDLTLGGNYSWPSKDWHVGVQFSFSLVRDPLRHRYTARRSGAASGGNLALQAFLDDNANGRLDEGEMPVSGVRLTGGAREEMTDASGQALLTGLGYGPSARVTVNVDEADIGSADLPPESLSFLPRQGKVAVAAYPISPVGEAMVHVQTRRSNGSLIGISSVRVRLTSANGVVHEAVTEYDGSVLFERLRPGTYALELDPDQAERLGMTLASPVRLAVFADGAGADADALVIFNGATQ